ncbi:MAG: hypothetical protein LBJ89_01500 [Holosporales bacterium]|jgi:septal ring factor EnvC (AmiA/AmiB activator)|nr:hypothetical protein [Holosporales bacterium]
MRKGLFALVFVCWAAGGLFTSYATQVLAEISPEEQLIKDMRKLASSIPDSSEGYEAVFNSQYDCYVVVKQQLVAQDEDIKALKISLLNLAEKIESIRSEIGGVKSDVASIYKILVATQKTVNEVSQDNKSERQLQRICSAVQYLGLVFRFFIC